MKERQERFHPYLTLFERRKTVNKEELVKVEFEEPAPKFKGKNAVSAAVAIGPNGSRVLCWYPNTWTLRVGDVVSLDGWDGLFEVTQAVSYITADALDLFSYICPIAEVCEIWIKRDLGE